MNRGHAIAGWLRGFAQLLVEVESGARPVRHIRPMLSPPLRSRIGHAGRPDTAVPNVGKVLLQTSPESCEAVVLLHHDNGRTTAMTVTLGRDQDGWVVTDLGRPEDPPQAAPVTEPLVDEEIPTRLGWHREPVESAAPMWVMPRGWTRQEPPGYDHAA